MLSDKGQKMTLKGRDGRAIGVRLEVNPKAKRLILRLDERTREAVAVAPTRRELRAAANFAAERVDWISERLETLPVATPLAEGTIITLRGEPCRLTLEGRGRVAKLGTHPDLHLSAPGDAGTFGDRVLRYLRRAAVSDLGDAVERHCATLGVNAQRITVKDTRSRWGSCTADGRLSFSWRLILAPPDVLDYVAAHECAHLVEMNHSAAFWAQVACCRPDWPQQRDWLRSHGRNLHAIGTV
ncbi:MAG: SprT family zinc-dependent metalloprotease [Pseudomonadota bacterium]